MDHRGPTLSVVGLPQWAAPGDDDFPQNPRSSSPDLEQSPQPPETKSLNPTQITTPHTRQICVTRPENTPPGPWLPAPAYGIVGLMCRYVFPVVVLLSSADGQSAGRHLPIAFEPNQGQTVAPVTFIARAPGF